MSGARFVRVILRRLPESTWMPDAVDLLPAMTALAPTMSSKNG
jgi:hypothetical protein